MENKKNMDITVAALICVALIGFLIFISTHKQENMNSNSLASSQNKKTEVAQNGDMVSMNYTGRLQDGTVFDSNVDPKFQHVEPFVFVLGAEQVIPGWEKGIVGMK